MKSIKMKILALAMSLLLVSISVISVISILATYNSTMSALEESMVATIDAAADMVEVQLQRYRQIANQFAVDPIFSQEIPDENVLPSEENPNVRTRQEVVDEIHVYAEELKALHNIESIDIFSSDGVSINFGIDYSQTEFFQVPRDTGEAYIADPTLSPDTGMLTMPITAPIIRDGEFEGVVLFAINPEVFSTIVSKISVGEGSTTTIINSQGITIAYNEVEYVFDAYNATEEAKSDPSIQALADLEQELMAGREGFENVTWDGVDSFAAYTPIDDSNGWGIYVMTAQENFLAQMNTSIITVIIISIVILVVSAFIIIFVARKISKPIKLCADRLNQVAEGDLKSPMPEINTKDETGVLANSTASIVNAVTAMINDLNYILSEIASGNFAVESRAKEYYIGDFSSLKDSTEAIVKKLSATMQKISEVSEQVSSGNNQVALGAQSLAQGAIEQASSIQLLSTTIEEISAKIAETASDSQTAKTANEKSQIALEQSSGQMDEMIKAMENISEKSREISNIIKTIDDIAFQTNILSLNAAVEAARAGAAGKGFAVVADEVRSLATKSAQSAKDTASLIEETVSAVNVGNKIVSSTSNSINVALQNAKELSLLVDGIATASTTQAEGASQVSDGIDQIAAVVHTNSATAEQSAAASEQLSSQSQILKDLMNEFTLNGNHSYHNNTNSTHTSEENFNTYNDSKY